MIIETKHTKTYGMQPKQLFEENSLTLNAIIKIVERLNI